MFDIGWSELLVVGIVALVVVGPKELPGLLRSLGKAIATVRRMAGDFQSQFNEAMREAELDELRKEVDALRSTAKGYLNVPDVPSIVKNELRSSIQDAGADTALPSPASAAETAATTVASGALASPQAATEPMPADESQPESTVPVEAALHEPAPAAEPTAAELSTEAGASPGSTPEEAALIEPAPSKTAVP